jgi:hypothetical protein
LAGRHYKRDRSRKREIDVVDRLERFDQNLALVQQHALQAGTKALALVGR